MVPDFGLVGEASSEGFLGQGIRIGRRGSINVTVRSRGIQGHVAWPEQEKNAVHPLVKYLDAAVAHDWGTAEEVFPKTSIQVTNITVPNTATNVVPDAATARLNVRFNRQFTGLQLSQYFAGLAAEVFPLLTVECKISGEPYLSQAPALLKALTKSLEARRIKKPSLNAGGGVSDGRFLHTTFPVVEFGLPGDTAHQIDERVAVKDIYTLTDIYENVLINLAHEYE